VGLTVLLGAGASSACGSSEELNRVRHEANEAGAIANVRIVLAAQATYSAGNAGAYGSMECLADPKTCVAADPGQPYVEKGFLSAERSGYTYQFHAGADSPQATGRPRGASLSSFAIVATPAASAPSTARRFCGDASMNVCTLSRDSVVSGGQCPSSCQPLQ
jgi:hypothetical protein